MFTARYGLQVNYKMEVILVVMIYNVTKGRVCLDTILYVQEYFSLFYPTSRHTLGPT